MRISPGNYTSYTWRLLTGLSSSGLLHLEAVDNAEELWLWLLQWRLLTGLMSSGLLNVEAVDRVE